MKRAPRHIRLVVTEDLGDRHDLLIESDDDGVDIREEGRDCPLDADRCMQVEIGHKHCDGCPDGKWPWQYIGLTRAEMTLLSQWRQRKALNLSPDELGRVLDKAIRGLQEDKSCESEYSSISLRVESADE